MTQNQYKASLLMQLKLERSRTAVRVRSEDSATTLILGWDHDMDNLLFRWQDTLIKVSFASREIFGV